jgi:hypothetical protein
VLARATSNLLGWTGLGIGERDIQTYRQQGDLIRLLSFFQNKEIGLKIDLRETGWGEMDCIHLAQDSNQWRALVNMVINIRVL